jgi:maltooligosyltrehalose trehalohydrolase
MRGAAHPGRRVKLKRPGMIPSSELCAPYWPTPVSADLPPVGAVPQPGGPVSFTVWAPDCPKLLLVLNGPAPREIPMRRERGGYFAAVVADLPEGARYCYRLPGGAERPDPASRFQPDGVHAPSQVVSTAFDWQSEGWKGLPLERYIFYELHIGTFTSEGTFDAAIAQLPRLAELGVTAIEIMPVAQFPGSRNWGYDGAYCFAVQNSYGGPGGLKRLVDACHRQGLAVVLDVVYNHLGPEGNYLADFGPYFTDRYRTPWGAAINFDGPHSDEVRRFFIENALYWVTEFRIDGLRLDAVHAITDKSAVPFLEELAEAVHRQAEALGRAIWLFPESDANDARIIRPRAAGGYGLDAQWTDGFHHAIRALLTGENTGYYADYGKFPQLAKAYRDGYVYTGEYSRYRRRRYGSSTAGLKSRQFIVFSQNHDQTGNRMLGERLSTLTDFETLKLAAAAVLLSPFTPLLFMGEEYGETAPFQYFVSHTDPELVESVRRGRKEEFAAFAWQGECPDPQSEATFLRSKINPELSLSGNHAILNAFYTELMRLRRILGEPEWDGTEIRAMEKEELLVLERRSSLVFLNFGTRDSVVSQSSHGEGSGVWQLALDSAAAHWNGAGPDPVAELDTRSGSVQVRVPPRGVLVYFRTSDGA